MTRKGLVFSVVLSILLLIIIISATIRSINLRKEVSRINENADNSKPIDDFDLDLTYVTGFDLGKLKSYELPIIIQLGSSDNELCVSMYSNLKALNVSTRGKAIIKYIDTKNYKELWNDTRFEVGDAPIQLLFDSKGDPYETNVSEALGYKFIKDDTRKTYLYYPFWGFYYK